MTSVKVIAKNKKAFFDFEIIDKFEAGIILNGAEVKSIRHGNVNLKGSYVLVTENAAFVNAMHVGRYENATLCDYDPTAQRKLLLNLKEIDKLRRAESDSGLTVVPLDLYLKKGLIKMTIAIVRGKKQYDKRQTVKKRDQDRQISRIMKNR